VTWRVGRRVPRNLYENDQDIGRMDTPELAARVVQAVNNADALSWLPRDFAELYALASDVSESWLSPELPRKFDELKRAVKRLQPTFSRTEEMNRYARERKLGA